MKTMHHFCDNCLNYYSKWMAHLGWSLLSASEKRRLLSFIYFVPSVQHWTLLLRPPKSVVRLCLVSGGPCARQQSTCIGRGDFCAASSLTSIAAALLHGATPAKFALGDLPRQVHRCVLRDWSRLWDLSAERSRLWLSAEEHAFFFFF